MITSFSADYLYHGALLLSPSPDEIDHATLKAPAEEGYGLLRGIYTLGLLVVAPFGAIYHAGKAGFDAIQSLRNEDETVKKTLSDRAWQHLTEAGKDLLALGLMAAQLLMVAVAVISAIAFYFGAYNYALQGLLLLATPLILAYLRKESIEDLFITYQFASTPTCFINLLSHKRNGAEPSQQDVYKANYLYAHLLKTDQVKDEPLSNQEILELSAINPSSDSPFSMIFAIQEILLNANKVTSTFEQTWRDNLARKPAIEAAWQESIKESNMAEAEEERSKQILEKFANKLKNIIPAVAT